MDSNNQDSMIIPGESKYELEYGIIYFAKNTVNGKFYVGQTIGALAGRVQTHVSDSKYKPKTPIDRAIAKYGIEKFSWFQIDKVVNNQKEELENQKELDNLEMYYIDFFDATNPNLGYNISPGGRGRGRVSFETREKLSRSRRGFSPTVTPARLAFYERRRGVPRKEGFGKRISEKLSGKKFPERSEVMSKRLIDLWQNPEYKAMQSTSHRKKRTKKYRSKKHKIIYITDGVTNRGIHRGLDIPEGWRRGRKSLGFKKKRAKLTYSHFWITNGITNQLLRESSPIPEGWRRGLTKKESELRFSNGKPRK